MLHLLHLYHPVYVMVVDPISVKNRIWGDENGYEFGMMPTAQGFIRCDVRSLWLVTIHKSKDRFLERSPLKIIQSCGLMGTTCHSIW
jgi:hypothetical protein